MHLLASLDVIADAVGKAVSARVKVWVFSLLLRLHLLENLALLFLRQLFSIDARVLSGNCSKSFSVFLLFQGTLISCRVLHQLRWLDVVFRSLEIKLDVRLNTADLVLGAALNDIDGVVATTILDVDCVTLVKHGVVGKLLLKDSLGVAKVNECRLVRPNLHIRALLQVHITQDNLTAFLDAEIVHHPDGNVAHALFRGEFEDTTKSLDAHLRV